jgi:multiubiquitin
MPSTIPQADKATKPVTISVNGADVVLPRRKTTGAAIKQAAITAGVPIQPDFVLYARRGSSKEYTRVDDDEVVTVHPGEKFRAVAPDDVA